LVVVAAAMLPRREAQEQLVLEQQGPGQPQEQAQPARELQQG
jgi:hypothetical protein